jgi:adenylate cyclase
VCGTPLTGALGRLGRVAGIRRSGQNPNLCNRCDVHLGEGRIVEVAVLFADLTGFTPLTNRLGPERTHQVVDAFLRAAKEAVVKWDGFVLQFAGDEVMALFNVPIGRGDFARCAVAAASEIQQGMPGLAHALGEELRVTVGIARGHARVGRLGSDDLKDFTAVGSVVNRAARLVARAAPGDIVVDDGVLADVADQYPEARLEDVMLKGFDEPVAVASLGSGRLPEGPGAPVLPPQRAFRLGLLASAVLGAPCAGLMMLSPLGIGASLGAAGVLGAATFLDQAAIRVPLLLLATAAALANLTLILRGRREPDGFEAAPTGGSAWVGHGRAGRIGVLVSTSALALVFFELFAHRVMHGG